MAGRGSRFANEGYVLPKPLIKIGDKPMIQVVINNLRPSQEYRFIFLCLKDHIEEYQVDQMLRKIEPSCVIVTVDEVTEGAACTVLLAKAYINNQDPLMIANSDQYINTNIDDYLNIMQSSGTSGLIMTMKASDPKWSFVRLNENGSVVEVVEKKVVSDEATVGIYNFESGKTFVDAAELMIRQDLRVNGEFYVAPAYNEMIRQGLRVDYYNIGSELNGMYGLGTPTDLEKFISFGVMPTI